MSVQPSDIAIFLVSFAACAYCIVLSRRLKTLQNTKDGLGATIMALSQSTSAISSTTKEARMQAEEAACRLAQLLSESNQMCNQLELLTQDMKTTHLNMTQQINNTQIELSTTMRGILDQSRNRMMDMSALIGKMLDLTNIVTTDSGKLVHRIDDSITRPRTSRDYRYET